jgi:hypothetical protein
MGFPALRVLDHPHPPLTSSEWRVRVVEPTPGQMFQGCGASGSPTKCGCNVVDEEFGDATEEWCCVARRGCLTGPALRAARVPPAELICVYAVIAWV